jgi:glycosyltransferase involved in cell wall biosynthesis
MTEKIRATVAILTRNSGATIANALESVRDFDDIIVCDGYSADETREIARRYGARIIDQDRAFLDAVGRIVDYAGVRNQTLDAAWHDAYFFLDSDEYADDALVRSIRCVVEERGSGAFWVNRMYVRGGIVIKYATTYPNRQMRFFFRSSAKRFIKRIHERIDLPERVVPENLAGTLYVPLDVTLTELRRKWRYQTSVEVLRVGALTPSEYIMAIASYIKVSLLYALRHARILILFQRPRMPFAFEMERHVQHVRLALALFGIVRWR